MKKQEKHEPYKAKVLELFGGIGASRVALDNLFADCKVKTVDYVDILNWAVEAYKRMAPTCYLPQSVVEWNLDVDICIHGSPCQDFSMAGLGKGGEVGSGTRSSLLWETIDIIQNRLNKKPRVVIWENVKGVLSKTHRHIFDKYLLTMESLGYVNEWKVLNGVDFGIPQRRERVFVVSILKDDSKFSHFKFANLDLVKTKPLKEFLEEDAPLKYFIKQKSMVKAIERGKIKIVDGIVQTITTKQMRWNNAGVIKVPLTTFNNDNFITNGEDGNIQTISANSARNIKVAIPLENNFNFKNNTAYVPFTSYEAENKVQKIEEDASLKTILAQNPKVQKIAIPLVKTKGKGDFAFWPRVKDGESINGNYNRVWKEDEAIGTVSGMNPPKTAIPLEFDGNYYEVKLDENGEALPVFIIDDKPYHVRIITEREAWRLMGFEDRHFDKILDLPSTAKYHLAGNSMIVQVMEAIFKELFWSKKNKDI